ncbi:MAG: hypothetical protein A3E01_04685 [Gammaproteobacteria bacterium RIFCSPHIGHO2_12_FULL_63_22]|nr:MAG: hypothetical protein A3E01_04685 [Gammaproteobacteria bacterium RIFCSPHIGHO2_12_FULL_63_22]
MIGESGSNIGYIVGGLGVVAAVGQMAWQRFFTKEGKGSDLLVQQLTERIAAQESRIISVETGLDQEREARRQAENKVHALELDNLLLRAELRRHGIDVGAALQPDYALRVAPAAQGIG